MEPLEQMEEFYNFKELCCAVLRKDIPQAWKQFEGQAQYLFDNETCSLRAMRIFLTSMNRSLYNYLLFTLDLSFHKCCFQNATLMHSCETKEQFYEIARQIIRSYCEQFYSPSSSCHVMKAREYIEENLAEELSLCQVAVQVHISSGHLSELFTACTGKSFSAYVKERRLERASQLLLSTQLTIQEVGQSCGFSSSAYFSTVFTKWAGISPRRYRALAEQNQRHTV